MIGIITALPKEFAAVKALLENGKKHSVPGKGAGRRYWLGEIPTESGDKHEVVLALLPDMGHTSAAIRTALLFKHFPDIQYIIMTGIAGGAPHPEKPDEHVRLGDIVVCDENGVVQYDIGTETETVNPKPRPRPPSSFLLEAVQHLEASIVGGERPWSEYIELAAKKLKIVRPAEKTDKLASYRRPWSKYIEWIAKLLKIVRRSGNPRENISHPERPEGFQGQPYIFYGTIASANVVLKNAAKRDALRDKFYVKAFEMEGSGIADATWYEEKNYLVVRGICDYCDPYKNKTWQKYAAVAAAAYTRALLESIPTVDMRDDCGKPTADMRNDHDKSAADIEDDHDKPTTDMRNDHDKSAADIEDDHDEPTTDVRNNHGKSSDKISPKSEWLSIMCDRDKQVADFARNIKTKNHGVLRGHPRFYLIHGEQGECHKSLIERISILLIDGYTEKKRNIEKTVYLKNAIRWPREGSLRERQEDLLFNMDSNFSPLSCLPGEVTRKYGHSGHGADSDSRLPYSRFDKYEEKETGDIDLSIQLKYLYSFNEYSIIILPHDVYIECWDGHDTELMLWYMEEHKSYCAKQINTRTPQCFVFLNIIYPKKEEVSWIKKFSLKWRRERQLSSLQKEDIEKQLSSLQEENSDHSCLLKELKPVGRSEVLQWFKDSGIIKDERIWDEQIDDIFKGRQRISMQDIEPELRELVAKHQRRWLSYESTKSH